MNATKRIMQRTAMLLAAGFLGLLCCGALAAAGTMTLDLAASTIQITTFYNGTTLEVSGTMPADADVVLEVSGPKKDVPLKVKGKVGGFLWMNKTDVELKNTPAVYMVYMPDKADQELATPGVGYDALADEITIEPESADKSFVFGEYVKLMEKSGVYAVKKGAIGYGPVENGSKTFSVTLTIPPKMSAGIYQVRALAIRNGAVEARAERKLEVVLTGLPKMIAALAFDHSLLFGIMAVVIAVATGLIIGSLFKGGGGAH